MLWFDRSRDLFLVFLTNRSLGSSTGRTFRAMRELRANLSDEITRVAARGVLRGGDH
jgi:hypothetical protein